MAEEVGGIVYEVGMDVKGLKAGQQAAESALDGMDKSAKGTTDSFNKLDKGARNAGNGMKSAGNNAATLKTAISTLSAAISISLVMEWAKTFLTVADNMTQLQARIARLSTDAAAAKQTFSDLAAIASRTGASLSDTTKLWETLTSSLKEAGATNSQVLNLTDTLQKIGRIGGSSTEEMANALRQFGQSIASGTIRAEEFNSILEQMPELARQIATGLGMSMGQLRQAMLDGKLTAQDALNAIQDRTGAVNTEFAKLPRTMDQATGSLETSFAKLVASINTATGASSVVVSAIDMVAQSVDTLASSSVSGANKLLAFVRVLALVNPVAAEAVAQFDKLNTKSPAIEMAEQLAADMKNVTKETKEAAKATDHFTIKGTGSNKTKKAGGKSTEEKQAESIAEKLEQLRQKSMLAAESTAELSREQTILRAEQSLGKGATQEQIKLAGEYAAASYDAAKALKERGQAEQANKAATQVQAEAKIQVNPATGVAEDPFAKINLEETQKLALYQQYYEQGLISKQTYEDTKTSIEQMAANERTRISEEATKTQQQNMSMLLGSSSDFFGQMAGAVGDYAGESSTAYKALFAVSKGFAIAQAGMNLFMAISNAAALPWPANIPAIAFAAAQGANLISQIRGANYGGGRKNGGDMSPGNYYEVGENGLPEIFQASNGRQYMVPGNGGQMFSNKDVMSNGGGGVVVYNNITNNANARVSSTSTQNSDGSVTISTIVDDIQSGGQISQAISTQFDTQRRATE